MTTLNEERLLRLAELLDTVDPEQFDHRAHVLRLPEQGFIGDAIGHAAMDPWFRGQGLRIVVPDDPFREFPYIAGADGKVGSIAVAAFFGLKLHESKLLFDRYEYSLRTGPKDVAARIRGFAEKGVEGIVGT